ncbi:MAG: hypothetical protein ACRD2A_06760 [Vicinamibacterales bacterium]
MRTLVSFFLLNAGAGTMLSAQTRSNAFTDFTIGTNFLIGNAPINGEYYEGGHGFAFLAFGNQPDENRSLVARRGEFSN